MVINEAVSGLLLDERNPRFREQVSGQDEAVTALLVDGASKLGNLAQDIANEGSLNPTELPVVVEEDGELVVIEGNRRLAALKLLRNPDLAKAAGDQLGLDLVKRFKALQQIGFGPDSIDVFKADDREAARHWMELRHTGENSGIGVLGWQTWQTNNYRRRRGSQADRATLFCEAVETDFVGSTSLLSEVATVRRNRLTTLGRLVTDPDFRREFGFQFDGDGVLFDYDSDDLRQGFMRIFGDLSKRSGITVSDIKSKAQRQAYISDRSDVLPDRARRLAEPRRPGDHPPAPGGERDDGTGNNRHQDLGSDDTSEYVNKSADRGAALSDFEDPAPGTASETKGGNPKTPPLENVIFKALKLPSVNVRIRDLLKLAQQINIIDAAPICGILVRVLIELAVTEAIQVGAVPGQESDSLKKKLRAGLLALDPVCENPAKRDKTLEMAWTRTQDVDGLSIQTLNAFVHNIYGQAAPTEVRALSLTFRPLLLGLDQLIASSKK